MRCSRKRTYKPGKQCDFELMAQRQKNGTINVYAHSEHNHPFMPESTGYFCEHLILYFKKIIDRRASIGRANAKQMIPAEKSKQKNLIIFQ
jgi:hypothetical protein